MWDIKIVELELNGKKITKYYLNHVGYKDADAKLDGTTIRRYYLNHVGYKVR